MSSYRNALAHLLTPATVQPLESCPAYRDLQQSLYGEYLHDLLDYMSVPAPGEILRHIFGEYVLYLDTHHTPAEYFPYLRQDVYRIFHTCGFTVADADTLLDGACFLQSVQDRLTARSLGLLC